MRHACCYLLIVVSGIAAGGCSSSVARPNWLNPGPVAYQRNQALRYDPYPEDSIGPAIVGGRPREYDQPREPAPLRPNPVNGPVGGAAPVQLQPTPGPYSPAPDAPAPAGPYPQTPYVAPQYPNTQIAPAPVNPAPRQ